jgi:putative oxidoreductase
MLPKTETDYMVAFTRLVLGFLFFVHGSQLMLGWFGGFGLSGSMHFFTQQLGIPAAFAFFGMAGQFLGGCLLIVGPAGRVAALAIIGNMVVAVAKVHWRFRRFMNWFGTQKGEGFEYHLLVVTLGLLVVVRGSGAISLDRLLARVPTEVDDREKITVQEANFQS